MRQPRERRLTSERVGVYDPSMRLLVHDGHVLLDILAIASGKTTYAVIGALHRNGGDVISPHPSGRRGRWIAVDHARVILAEMELAS